MKQQPNPTDAEQTDALVDMIEGGLAGGYLPQHGLCNRQSGLLSANRIDGRRRMIHENGWMRLV